jgi:hypothetical protein
MASFVSRGSRSEHANKRVNLTMTEGAITWADRIANLTKVLGRKPTLNEMLDAAQIHQMTPAEIDYEEAKSLGLSTSFLNPNDDLWKQLWLLYCMYDFDTKANGIGRTPERLYLSLRSAE